MQNVEQVAFSLWALFSLALNRAILLALFVFQGYYRTPRTECIKACSEVWTLKSLSLSLRWVFSLSTRGRIHKLLNEVKTKLTEDIFCRVLCHVFNISGSISFHLIYKVTSKVLQKQQCTIEIWGIIIVAAIWLFSLCYTLIFQKTEIFPIRKRKVLTSSSITQDL